MITVAFFQMPMLKAFIMKVKLGQWGGSEHKCICCCKSRWPEFDSHRCTMVYMHAHTPIHKWFKKLKREACLIIALTLSGLLISRLLFSEFYQNWTFNTKLLNSFLNQKSTVSWKEGMEEGAESLVRHTALVQSGQSCEPLQAHFAAPTNHGVDSSLQHLKGLAAGETQSRLSLSQVLSSGKRQERVSQCEACLIYIESCKQPVLHTQRPCILPWWVVPPPPEL